MLFQASRYHFAEKGKKVPPGLDTDVPESTDEPVVSEAAGRDESGSGKGKGNHN